MARVFLASAAGRSPKPILVFSSVPAETMDEALQIFAPAKIPVLPSPTRVAHAAAVTAAYVETRAMVAARVQSRVSIAAVMRRPMY